MTRTIAEIDADLATLRGVMGSGTQQVRFADGRMATYRTQRELERAVAALMEERAATTGDTRLRSTFVEHSRG